MDATIMTGTLNRARLLACALVFALATPVPGAGAIVFTRSGPFESCLDDSFGKWVRAQAELMVNEDPSAGKLDDAAVAAWTITVLDDCRKRAGAGDATSEHVFSRHMSRWRQHVFDLAASIRRAGQSD